MIVRLLLCCQAASSEKGGRKGKGKGDKGKKGKEDAKSHGGMKRQGNIADGPNPKKAHIKCYVCNEMGHYASECPKREKKD